MEAWLEFCCKNSTLRCNSRFRFPEAWGRTSFSWRLKVPRSFAISADLNGAQTLLMVDDEDLLLTMGQTILSSFGYRVLTANSGQKALEILERNDPAVDLVITDLVMPAMSGRELVERIRQLAPDTRIICTSGYVWPASQVNDGAYLQKPFTSQDLLLKVKQALAG